ncbi:MAG: class I SAM-dependent methyltransferase [Flavobacteriaceae bacterium]|nr:class I SAM-dependent methyltransferase [Flavobacteriaceae bacterium]
MNTKLLNKDIQEFINAHLDSNPFDLTLKHREFNGVSMSEIAEQIDSKRRIKDKLPTWFKADSILYPNKSRLQQSSSEITARHKCELVSGTSIIDITGGFGVDCFYLAKSFTDVYYCEQEEELHNVAVHNFEVLKAKNIKAFNDDGLDVLKNSKMHFNWIYADPSRRHESKGKVFFIEDCQPDVIEHLDLFFNHSEKVLLKLSPMLDLSRTIKDLGHVKRIDIVAVNNELKELLFVLEKDYINQIMVNCFNYKGEQKSKYEFEWGSDSSVSYGVPEVGDFLYEPNVAILKGGAFKHLSHDFELNKLGLNSHLYFSNRKKEFPGRRFLIKDIQPYSNKSDLKQKLRNSQANISTRNFLLTVEVIRKKYKIKDGGDRYVFFTADQVGNKLVIYCKKA